MPALSIITINYNDKKGLEATIASVLEQSFKDYQYIVIDGGSNDGSKDVIEKNKNAIHYWVSEKDDGLYNAQNKGIDAAKGDYLLFLNSGDTLADKNILKTVFSKNITADIAYGNMWILYTDGRKEKGYMPELITFNHMIADTLWHPVSFIKRSLFEKFGKYNEQFKAVADYDFFLRVLMAEKVSTQYLNEFICVFNLEGFSSRPENVPQIKEERKKAQLQYFSEEKISEAVKENAAAAQVRPSFTQKLFSLFKK